MEKIQFEDYKEPYLNAETLNQMQNNIATAIDEKGSGSGIHIGTDEPTDTNVWINPDEPLNVMGTEVVDSLSGDETNKAPSVRAVNGTILFENEDGLVPDITLNESVANYNKIVIEFRIDTNYVLYGIEEVLNPNDKYVVLSRRYVLKPQYGEINYDQMVSTVIYIHDNAIECIQHDLVNVDMNNKVILALDDVASCKITKVIGYK